ncbi:MAG: FtsX-like permease family protein [Bacteroidales bacterium]|jgi:putative ABC transport system permease protein
MLKNYLKTFWKVARQNKLFTFLSLFGISLTIMFVMIFSMTVNKVVKGAGPERDLRNIVVASRFKIRTPNKAENHVFSSIPRNICEDYLKKIKSADLTTMYNGGEREFMINGKHYSKGAMATDADFWKVFDFKFLEGHAYTTEDVINSRNLAVITESMKEIFFGNEKNVVGKPLKLPNNFYSVVGVVEDPSPTSQILGSGLFYPYTMNVERPCPDCFAPAYMGSYDMAFKTNDRSKLPVIRKEVQGIIKRIDTADPKFVLFLRGPNTQWQDLFAAFDPEEDTGPWALLRKYLLWGFGFILLPAVNLMALNFARIRERGEEIAVRKSFGASSAVLKGQFIFENLVLTIAGGMIGILLSFLVVALLDNTLNIPVKAGTTVPMSFSFDFLVFGIALGVCLLFGLLSGVLPAIRMSRMKPVKYLKGGEL